MDITQIAILLGACAAQAISMLLPYWVGRQSGFAAADKARPLSDEEAELLRRAASLIDHADIDSRHWADAGQIVHSLHELANRLAIPSKEPLHA